MNLLVRVEHEKELRQNELQWLGLKEPPPFALTGIHFATLRPLSPAIDITIRATYSNALMISVLKLN